MPLIQQFEEAITWNVMLISNRMSSYFHYFLQVSCYYMSDSGFNRHMTKIFIAIFNSFHTLMELQASDCEKIPDNLTELEAIHFPSS